MDSNVIGSVVSPLAAARQLEIDRIEILPAGRRSVVRIFLDGDGPAGHGPSIDQIADATRAISRALDEAPLGNAPYTLEVSTRGVSRPLTEQRHFRRNVGRLVALTLAEGDGLTGRIVSVADDAVTLDVEGAEQVLPLASIAKAVVQVELNRQSGDVELDAAEDELDVEDDLDDDDDVDEEE